MSTKQITEEDIKKEFEALKSNEDPRFEELHEHLQQHEYQVSFYGIQKSERSRESSLVILSRGSKTNFKGLTLFWNPDENYKHGLVSNIVEGHISDRMINLISSGSIIIVPSYFPLNFAREVTQILAPGDTEQTPVFTTTEYIGRRNKEGNIYTGNIFETRSEKEEKTTKISGEFELKRI
jgi:hypothetical protein